VLLVVGVVSLVPLPLLVVVVVVMMLCIQL
jgi:hypothetical protein